MGSNMWLRTKTVYDKDGRQVAYEESERCGDKDTCVADAIKNGYSQQKN